MCWVGVIGPPDKMPAVQSHLVWQHTGLVPCLVQVLLKTPCNCACDSVMLWGGTLHHELFMYLVPYLMLLMMHQLRLQPQLHQPWRLDR